MPRANRYFLPGHVWHITHRCHKKEFLLKFSKDRKKEKQIKKRDLLQHCKLESKSLICKDDKTKFATRIN